MKKTPAFGLSMLRSFRFATQYVSSHRACLFHDQGQKSNMPSAPESKRGRRWVIPIAIVLAMILLGILTLRFGSVRILSVVLERQLHVPVQVVEFDLSVFGDSIAVRDLRLGQPEGFGSEAMVTVDKIDLVGWRNVLFSDRRLTALNASDRRHCVNRKNLVKNPAIHDQPDENHHTMQRPASVFFCVESGSDTDHTQHVYPDR